MSKVGLPHRPNTGDRRSAACEADSSCAAPPGAVAELADNRPAASAQRELVGAIDRSPRIAEQEAVNEQIQRSPFMAAQRKHVGSIAPPPSDTGLPDRLKSGIESLSGMSMDKVRVHYNSSRPARLHALAYARGTDIHVAPGRERHLPHEAWHVVQQAQGRVPATRQMKEAIPVNDDDALEREADRMGERALQLRAGPASPLSRERAALRAPPPERAVAQLAGVFTVTNYDFNPDTGRHANQVVANARFGPALVQFVANNLQLIAPAAAGAAGLIQTALRTRLTNDAAGYANWNDLAAADVEALADAVVAHLLRNPGGGNLVPAALRGGVVNALAYGLPSAASDAGGVAADRSQLTANEIVAFEQMIGACTATSRAKGTPNTIAVGALNAVNGLDVAFTALRQTIIDRNAALIPRMAAEYDLLTAAALGGDAGLDMEIRSMHQNGAGWLPAGAVALPTTLAALRAQINAAYHLIYTGARRAAIETLPRETQKTTRAAIRRTEVNRVVNPLARRTKIMLIWGSYAESAGALMNYVEFNLGSRINRLMYDYVNGRFYLTAHYNWYKGYNPFFEVTGATD